MRLLWHVGRRKLVFAAVGLSAVAFASFADAGTTLSGSALGMMKDPAVQNVFLARQGDKIPPGSCLAGTDVGSLSEQLTQEITGQALAAFEFEVRYDGTEVCVALTPGPEFEVADAICSTTSSPFPTLEGSAVLGCDTTGKGLDIDELAPLARIDVYPQPDMYSKIKPNQDNHVVVEIENVNCELGDEQGAAIPIASCDGAHITFRYLEADVHPDCVVDAADAQAVAFRWGVKVGSSIYRDFFNVQPSGLQADNDIDANDLQFVLGRFGSTCDVPKPPQPPLNPQA